MYSDYNYHVLSNEAIIKIIIYAIFAGCFFCYLFFSSCAKRDPSSRKQEKGWLGIVIPWVLLCLLICNIFVLVLNCIEYPWYIDPSPSEASAYREISEKGISYVDRDFEWGWANDDQLPILQALSTCILCFGWTIYAFYFKPSDTSWWKKICKILAYVIVSIIISGFRYHEIKDLFVIEFILILPGILLYFARVTPAQTQTKVLRKNDGNVLIDQCHKIAATITDDSSMKNNDISQEESHENNRDRDNDKDSFYCKHCGKEIEKDSIFCKYCGGVQ